MNPKVQELIAKRQEEIKAAKLSKRNEHLARLGLAEGIKKTYVDNYTIWDPKYKYDHAAEKYYIETYEKAIDITDEEYDELCKYFPEDEDNVTSCSNNEEPKRAENTLRAIANFILGTGILCSIVYVIFVISAKLPVMSYLISVILLFMACLVSWAILKCIADMSATLKEIKAKMK